MGLEFEGQVYRWAEAPLKGRTDITLLNTDLRDGSQASGIEAPKESDKIQMLKYMDSIGIHYADIAMPVAKGKHLQEAIAVAKAKRELGLSINLVCLARALPGDVHRAIELRDQSQTELEVIIFKGSSPLRRGVEGWATKEDIVDPMVRAIRIAIENGLKVTAATEDTTRTEREVIKSVFCESISAGATRVCIADTVGFSDPWSTAEIVSWIKKEVIGESQIGLDWHGHNDVDMTTANALIALGAGADRVHVTSLGIGERAGNTPMESMIENLRQHGINNYKYPLIMEYASYASKVFGRIIPPDKPIVGDLVHKTPTGIHGAGIAKAIEKGRPDLAGIIYSAVDPSIYGRHPELSIGPLSGNHNAIANLERLNIEVTQQHIQRILVLAQMLGRELSDEEISSAALMDEKDFMSYENNGFSAQ